MGICVMGLSGMLAASGCIIIRPPQPFERQVAGRQLDVVAASLAEAAPAALEPAAPEPAVLEPAVLEPAAAAQAPARTDIKGLGDGSMKTERVVVTAAKDIAHRAPNFSPEQARAMLCAAQKRGFSGETAQRMYEATVAAAMARDAWDAGAGSRKSWQEAEKKRQDAVIGYMAPPVLNWFVSPGEKKADMPKPEFGAVRIEGADLFTFKEDGREVVAVTGVVRNTGAERIELPPVTLRAIDEWEFSLAGQTSLLPFEALDPGEARVFELRFFNPPAYMAEVFAHFAPPFMYRSRRDCDAFDPGVGTAEAAPGEAPARILAARLQADGKPAHTAAELNQLTLFYRGEAEAAWRCANLNRETCEDGRNAQRLHWRDLFAMSEALDATWMAERAAQEVRARAAGDGVRDGVRAGASEEAARQRAVAQVFALGKRALARAGGSAAGVEVALNASEYGMDAAGLYLEVAGVMRNVSGEERRVDALMVAFVDRLELPLSSVAVETSLVLAPGEEQAFAQRLEARQGRGARRGGAAARIPPRDIAWEVRVGAMTK